MRSGFQAVPECSAEGKSGRSRSRTGAQAFECPESAVQPVSVLWWSVPYKGSSTLGWPKGACPKGEEGVRRVSKLHLPLEFQESVVSQMIHIS